jgi:transcriptional regulator with XRE-family HTH domain
MLAEWSLVEADDEEMAMALGERIRLLRKEHGWSQAELGAHVGTDSQRISRYENGRITPSVEALVRLADALEVSVDYLVKESSPRRPINGPELGVLSERLVDLAELDEEDRALVAGVVDGLVARRRLKALAGGMR